MGNKSRKVRLLQLVVGELELLFGLSSALCYSFFRVAVA